MPVIAIMDRYCINNIEKKTLSFPINYYYIFEVTCRNWVYAYNLSYHFITCIVRITAFIVLCPLLHTKAIKFVSKMFYDLWPKRENTELLSNTGQQATTSILTAVPGGFI